MSTIYGILAVVLWGVLALLGNMTRGIPAFQLLALCFLISALIVVIKRALSGKPILKRPSLTPLQWLVGIYGLFGYHFCYFMALRYAPAIEVSLIAYMWPLLLALFVATKKTMFKALCGGCIGFIGISFIILGEGNFTLSQEYVWGYTLSVICAFVWSSYSWFLSRSSNEVEDIGWLSAVVAILAFIAHWQLEPHNWSFSLSEWTGIVLLGLGPVGGAFYLWDMGLKHGNKQLLASLSFGAPLISSVALYCAGLNAWSSNIIIAMLLILLGALISNMKKPSHKKGVESDLETAKHT